MQGRENTSLFSCKRKALFLLWIKGIYTSVTCEVLFYLQSVGRIIMDKLKIRTQYIPLANYIFFLIQRYAALSSLAYSRKKYSLSKSIYLISGRSTNLFYRRTWIKGSQVS
jgi:hypothetical protein